VHTPLGASLAGGGAENGGLNLRVEPFRKYRIAFVSGQSHPPKPPVLGRTVQT